MKISDEQVEERKGRGEKKINKEAKQIKTKSEIER